MKFDRSFNQRKSLFKNQLNLLINIGKLTTTLAKAKFIKGRFDKLVSKAKVNSVHVRRQLAAELSSVPAANKLVDVIAPLFGTRTSGFTSIAKTSVRKGDGVTLATLTFMEELPKVEKKVEKKAAKKETKTTKTK